jgi:hypothetical protein
MRRVFLLLFVGFCFFAFSRADELISVGNLGEVGELISSQEMKEGPDGNIYVYDQQDGYIKVYGPKGKFLRKIGGQGQGPGEIQRIEDVSFGFLPEEKLYFTEFLGGHSWITVMELSGEFSRVIKLKFKERFGLIRIHALSDGKFLAQVSFVGKPKKLKDYFLHSFPITLFVLDQNGVPVKELITTNYYIRISYLSGGGDAGIPFTPHFSWCYYKDDLVVFADGISNKFKLFNFEGTLIKEIETYLPEPKKVTHKDLDAWRKEAKESLQVRDGGAWYNQFGNVIEKYKKSIYDVKPILSSLSRTPDGNVLVSGIWDRGKRVRSYWLLDENGAGLAELKVSVNDMRITKSFILFRTEDEDFFSQVHALQRTGSEKDDLLRLSAKIVP